MAVFIFSTGSIPTPVAISAGDYVGVSVDNRTNAVQTLRADLYDTSNGNSPKILLASQPVATIGPSGAVFFLLTSAAQDSKALNAFEVEIRLSSEHMAANITSASGVISSVLCKILPILPNEFFRDSDPGGSV